MLRKIFTAALAAMLLCSCSENKTEQLTISITSETEYPEVIETEVESEDGIFPFGYTTAETSEAVTEDVFSETAAEDTPNGLDIILSEDLYGKKNGAVNIYFEYHSEITTDEIAEINLMCQQADETHCAIENAEMGSLAFLSECDYIENLFINKAPSDLSELIESVSEMDSLRVLIVNSCYEAENAIDELFMKMPDVQIEFSTEFPNDKFVDTGFRNDFAVGVNSPHVENNELGMWLYNNLDENINVTSAELYYLYNGKWISTAFKNGSYEIPFEMTAEKGYNVSENPYELYDKPYDFILSEDNFDFENAKTGRYRLIFDGGVHTAVLDFYLNSNSEFDFLTEEQEEILKGADSIINKYFSWSSYHPDEFTEGDDGEMVIREKFCPYLTYDFAYELSLGTYIDENGKVINGGGDRGSSILYAGNYIQPIYIGDDTIIMKRIVVNSHGDGVSDFSITACNIKMILTEEGWRVSRMYPYH